MTSTREKTVSVTAGGRSGGFHLNTLPRIVVETVSAMTPSEKNHFWRSPDSHEPAVDAIPRAIEAKERTIARPYEGQLHRCTGYWRSFAPLADPVWRLLSTSIQKLWAGRRRRAAARDATVP